MSRRHFSTRTCRTRAISAERWEEAEVIVAEVEAGSPAPSRSMRTQAPRVSACPKGGPDSAGLACTRRSVAMEPASSWHSGASMPRAPSRPRVSVHTASFMTTACAMYERMGFRRAPEHDLRASEVVHEEGGADITAIAYRLDLTRARGFISAVQDVVRYSTIGATSSSAIGAL